MRMIITLVASIAILGASPAPADAKWFKKVFKAIEDVGRKFDCQPPGIGRGGCTCKTTTRQPTKDAAEVQPTEDAAEEVGRKILEEVLQPTEDVAEKPVPERLDFGHVSDK